MLPSISIDDGFVSIEVKVHLQKFWIVLLHWSDAFDEQTAFCRLWNCIFDANWAFCWLWNGIFGSHMAFRWPWNDVLGALASFCQPWNGVLGAMASFASPGTAFWAPWQLVQLPQAPKHLTEIWYRYIYIYKIIYL